MDNWLSYVVAQIERIPSWAILSAVAVVAILVALALHRLLFYLLERQLRDSERFVWLLILKKSKAPSAFAAVMAALSLSLQLGPIGGTAATGLTRSMQIALITLLTWLAIVTTEIFSSVYLG